MDKPKKKLTVMVDEDELTSWKDAAHIRRSSLSAWVRRVLNATAEAVKKEGL